MEPRVTFIIAHHNYEQYLSKAITSALTQTYKNIHVCVIDDCSTNKENVLNIIEKINGEFNDIEINNSVSHQEKHAIYRGDKITYVSLDRDVSYKQAYARNRGIEACWGDTDVFAILDADDENYPTKIEKSVQILRDEAIGAVYTDTDILNVENGRIVREYREPFDSIKLLQECIVHSGCVIKKSALEMVLENGLVFDEDLPPCEDYDLWVRLSEVCLLYHIPESLVLVRVHQNNSTNTTTHEHRMSKIVKIFNKRNNRL